MASTKVLSVLAWVLLASPLTAAELPVETFFKNYEYQEAMLSPDGTCVCIMAPFKNRVGLAVYDLKTRAAQCAFANRSADVYWFAWVNNNRLICQLARDGYARSGLVSVDRDGKNDIEVLGLDDELSDFMSMIPGSSNEVRISTLRYATPDPETGHLFANVWRMNVVTGKGYRELTNPGRVLGWVTDQEGTIRIGVRVDGTRYKLLYRASEKGAWETLGDWDVKEDGIDPLGFEFDGRTLLVGHYGGQPTHGVYTYDLGEKRLKQLAFRHARADFSDIFISRKRKVVTGFAYETERPEIYWIDAENKRIQASLDRALPGTFNRVVSFDRDETKALVLATSDTRPGTYYFLDLATMKMEKLFDRTDRIKPKEMAEMKPIQYTSRDGLAIHGYLTLPKGSTGKNLPLIVNPHGGPHVRDSWGFDPEVQFFANRGYAVLRMNFRGSAGYGRDFLEAGFREWGRKQQDDITDGVKWAIDQGIADPKRICIYGASYGGFAALTGLEQTPELYCCGISYAGVTDIARMLRFQENRFRSASQKMALGILNERVGDRKADKELMAAVSPLRHVDQIRVPVFLAQGKLDPRVPYQSVRDMASALKKRGKLFDYMLKDEEGHGFHKEENRIEFYRKMDQFLKQRLSSN